MPRIFAIFLLALLPFHFSWAAVAAYRAYETRADVAHVGHHQHQHEADAGPGFDPVADPMADADPQGNKARGATDLDCGQCHGSCGVMVTVQSALPGSLSTALPRATLDETGDAQAPPRPERPQWRPVA